MTLYVSKETVTKVSVFKWPSSVIKHMQNIF